MAEHINVAQSTFAWNGQTYHVDLGGRTASEQLIRNIAEAIISKASGQFDTAELKTVARRLHITFDKGREVIADARFNKFARSLQPNYGISGIVRRGNTCYALSFLQSTPLEDLPLRKRISGVSHEGLRNRVREALLAIREQEGVVPPALVTEVLAASSALRKALGEQDPGWTTGAQQDMRELMVFIYKEVIRYTDHRLVGIHRDPAAGADILQTIVPTAHDQSVQDLIDATSLAGDIADHAPTFLPVAIERAKHDASGDKYTYRLDVDEELEVGAHTYRLVGATVQRGSARSGHYWAYKRTPAGFLKCNDDRVTPKTLDQVQREISVLGYSLLYERVER